MEIFSRIGPRRQLSRRLNGMRDRLYRIAYSWCHDPHLADDLVQQTLYKAVQKQHQLRDESALEKWLSQILANCFYDHQRSLRKTEDADEVEIVSGDQLDELTEADQLVQAVRTAIAKLPIGQRQVLTLVDLEGFSYADVAEALNIPVGTVMSRLCRARSTLREKMRVGQGKEIVEQIRNKVTPIK